MNNQKQLDLFKKLIHLYPEHRCVELQCLNSGSVCFNLAGNFDSKADYCACEYPYYGEHCQHSEIDLLEKSKNGEAENNVFKRNFLLAQMAFVVFQLIFVAVKYRKNWSGSSYRRESLRISNVSSFRKSSFQNGSFRGLRRRSCDFGGHVLGTLEHKN